MAQSENPRVTRSGFGFTVRMLVIACALLVFNSAVFTSIFESSAVAGLGFMKEPKVAQLALFIGPVMMLAGEWWILDRIFAR